MKNREYKFRARITENGKPKMFYQEDQYLISFLRRATSFLYFEKDDTEEVDDLIGVHESRLKDNLENYLDISTGLFDRNGREIYRGDILSNGKFIAEVYWGVGQAGFILTGGKHSKEMQDGIFELEVKKLEIIGNIHESPELLSAPLDK